MCYPGDPNLIVVGLKVGELYLRIGLDLASFLIACQISNVNREVIVDSDWRDGAKSGLGALVDCSEHWEFRLSDNVVSELVKYSGINGFRTGFHEKS